MLPNLLGDCRSPSLVNSTNNQLQSSMDIQYKNLKYLIDRPQSKNDLTKSAPFFKLPNNNLSMIQINDQEGKDFLREESKVMEQEESYEVH